MVDVLVDVVGRLQSGTDGMTACAGLDRKDWEKREINKTGDIKSVCHVSIM
jgi:hypothetical protein